MYLELRVNGRINFHRRPHVAVRRGGSRGGCGGCIPPPAIFKDALDKLSFFIISNLFITMGANPWRDISPPIIRQHPPQYFQVPKLGISERDDLFLVFTSFWAKNWASENVMTFIFGLHFILGKKMDICRRVNFAESFPPISKNGRFC